MIPLAKAIVDEAMKQAVLDVLESGWYILGDEVNAFEAEFARFCGTKYGVGVSSGTAALHLSLMGLGIGPCDEVITAANSFVASAFAVEFCGAKTVLADVVPETYNLDPSKLEEKITTRTKAIVPVHLYGQPADMDPIREIAERYDLYVVEDACQAHGAFYKQKRTGSLGHIACFSFYPSKCMTVCGDGGMIVTDDDELAENLRKLRAYGEIEKYKSVKLGFNLRLSEISAAIGRKQLIYLDKWNKLRRKHVKYYNQLLSDCPEIVTPFEAPWAFHVYYLYVIRVKQRDSLKAYLYANDIGTGIHYPIPIHLQPYYQNKHGSEVNSFPFIEQAAKEIISLPMYPELTKNEIEYVATKIKEFYE